jgi:hypothetical protein
MLGYQFARQKPIGHYEEDSLNLAQFLVDRQAIPGEFPEDALHVALATCHCMDFFLTWIFAHLNNAEK